MFLAVKVPEERTGRILAEIDRAEKIFKKMCDCGELEEEISKVSTAKQTAASHQALHALAWAVLISPI